VHNRRGLDGLVFRMAVRFFAAFVAEVLYHIVCLLSSDVDAVVVEPFMTRLALDVALVWIERAIADTVLRPFTRGGRQHAQIDFI
jgi:hypothetical protein